MTEPMVRDSLSGPDSRPTVPRSTDGASGGSAEIVTRLATQAVLEFRPARRNEIQRGMSLVLGHGGAVEGSAAQLEQFRQFAQRRGIDLSSLWVACAAGQVVWAALPVVSPGRTMLLLSPRWPEGIDVSPLIDAICRQFAQQGVHLAQALLDPGDAAARNAYPWIGFREVAELLYLQVGIRRTQPVPVLPQGFGWVSYSPDSHELFAQTIIDSYQGSLDCPALNGLRDAQEIITGHKASGQFDPQFWFLLLQDDDPRGVLLLNSTSSGEMAELVYLGLKPAARGRGLGDLLVRQALSATRQMQRPRLTLAVDAANQPALRLYYRHGMQRVASKMALLRDLRAT